LAVKSPIWDVKEKGDCKKIISTGIAEGMTEIRTKPQKGYEIAESSE